MNLVYFFYLMYVTFSELTCDDCEFQLLNCTSLRIEIRTFCHKPSLVSADSNSLKPLAPLMFDPTNSVY